MDGAGVSDEAAKVGAAHAEGAACGAARGPPRAGVPEGVDGAGTPDGPAEAGGGAPAEGAVGGVAVELLCTGIPEECLADPLYEMRVWNSSGKYWPFCIACRSWSDKPHLKTEKHHKRLQAHLARQGSAGAPASDDATHVRTEEEPRPPRPPLHPPPPAEAWQAAAASSPAARRGGWRGGLARRPLEGGGAAAVEEPGAEPEARGDSAAQRRRLWEEENLHLPLDDDGEPQLEPEEAPPTPVDSHSSWLPTDLAHSLEDLEGKMLKDEARRRLVVEGLQRDACEARSVSSVDSEDSIPLGTDTGGDYDNLWAAQKVREPHLIGPLARCNLDCRVVDAENVGITYGKDVDRLDRRDSYSHAGLLKCVGHYHRLGIKVIVVAKQARADLEYPKCELMLADRTDDVIILKRAFESNCPIVSRDGYRNWARDPRLEKPLRDWRQATSELQVRFSWQNGAFVPDFDLPTPVLRPRRLRPTRSWPCAACWARTTPEEGAYEWWWGEWWWSCPACRQEWQAQLEAVSDRVLP